MPTDLNTEEIEGIRKAFKRCSEDVIQAIIAFRQRGDMTGVPIVVRGIIVRYLPAETREAILTAPGDTPLASLGVESLTMLEIILDLQEAFDITIDDSELKRLQTIDDVNQFFVTKTRSRAESA